MKCVTCEIEQTPIMRDLSRCDNCTLVSSRYKSDPLIYDEFYCSRYNEYKDEAIGKKLMKIRADMVYRHVNKGNLLDYGCATGEFHISLNSGIVGHGYDINPNFGFSKVPAQYSILTMWDVIEHIDDPFKFLEERGPGYLFICTPSTDDFKGKDLGQWRHYRPHEHVHYFNELSLKALLKKLGYRILEVNYEESKVRKSGNEKNILSMAGEKWEK